VVDFGATELHHCSSSLLLGKVSAEERTPEMDGEYSTIPGVGILLYEPEPLSHCSFLLWTSLSLTPNHLHRQLTKTAAYGNCRKECNLSVSVNTAGRGPCFELTSPKQDKRVQGSDADKAKVIWPLCLGEYHWQGPCFEITKPQSPDTTDKVFLFMLVVLTFYLMRCRLIYCRSGSAIAMLLPEVQGVLHLEVPPHLLTIDSTPDKRSV
jgi:hypothetical protein